jgi:hypothetical protein
MSDNLTPPDIRDLLGAIAKEWGGTEALAKQIVEDVKKAPQGSSQRLSYHYHYMTALFRLENPIVTDPNYETDELEALRRSMTT